MKCSILVLLIAFCSYQINAQNYTISGQIKEVDSKEAVISCIITNGKDGVSKIKDIPNNQNYYRIVIKSKTIFTTSGDENELTWDRQTVLVDKEILFNDISGIGGEDEDLYKYRIFNNDLFKGKEYTLNVYIRKDNFHNAPDLIKDLVKVEIHSLSHNLYSYMKSLELALVEDNYQEPVKIYTNISGGYGIVGAYNVTEKVIETEND